MIKNTLLVMLIGFAPFGFATDIADAVRQGNMAVDQNNGGYFELFARAGCEQDARVTKLSTNKASDCKLAWGLGGEYRYRGLFIEASSTTRDGLNLGYTLWQNSDVRVDLLAASISGSYSFADSYVDPETPGLTETERNSAIVDRHTLYAGAGIRLTYYFGDNIFQYRLISDVRDGDGVISTARIGRAWQVRNWNLHSIAGLSYRSSNVNQKLVGINALEATERFPQYRPGRSLEPSFELGATYAISERMVSRTEFRIAPHGSAVRDSPLTRRDWSGAITTTLSIVF